MIGGTNPLGKARTLPASSAPGPNRVDLELEEGETLPHAALRALGYFDVDPTRLPPKWKEWVLGLPEAMNWRFGGLEIVLAARQKRLSVEIPGADGDRNRLQVLAQGEAPKGRPPLLPGRSDPPPPPPPVASITMAELHENPSGFPGSLGELSVLSSMGRGNQLTLMIRRGGTAKYVVVKGSGSGHAEESFRADCLYRLYGAPVPASGMYRKTGGAMVRLVQHVRGTTLSKVLEGDSGRAERVRQRLRDHFATIVLLGATDALGAPADEEEGHDVLHHVVVDDNDEPWLIHSGGALRRDSQGEGRPFAVVPKEWEQLRDPNQHRGAAWVFRDLRPEELAAQVQRLRTFDPRLEMTIDDPRLIDVLRKRLATMERLGGNRSGSPPGAVKPS